MLFQNFGWGLGFLFACEFSVTTILNQTSSKKSPNSNKLDSKSDSDPSNKTSEIISNNEKKNDAHPLYLFLHNRMLKKLFIFILLNEY